MTIKVSFDFDGTLARESIQKYAKELVERGLEVWICTARFESVEGYTEEFCNKYTIDNIKREHAYLFEVASKCGITTDHIKFTNMLTKDTFFVDHPDFVWHLDDDYVELKHISTTKVKAISAVGSSWKHKCEKLLK